MKLTENNTTEGVEVEGFDLKRHGTIGLRFVQILALGMVAVGLIWGLGDCVAALMPNGSAPPMSILLMLYGLVASLMIEIPIRVLKRKN